MNRKTSAGLLLLILSAISGCSAKVSLFPVSGPLSDEKPLPVLTATAEGITGNTGPISLNTPRGDTCVGRWSSVAPTYVASGTLFGQYGGMAGFSVSGIQPGVNKGQAFLTCATGTTFEAEFFTGSGTANGYGVAKDSNGNVYKMLF